MPSAKNYKLYGIAGFARTGKDTIGNYMAGIHNFRKYAFADPIKEAASKMFGVHLNDFYDNALSDRETVLPEWGYSPRQMIQMLGTEGGRDLFREDIWVKRGEIEWKNFCAGEPVECGMVITDVRFENEAKMIREMGGKIIHVFRDKATAINSHISEAGIVVGEEDTTIFNNGTLPELCDTIDIIIGES